MGAASDAKAFLVAALALGAAACDSAEEQPMPPPADEPPAPESSGPFAYALNFTCEGGSKLDVALQDGDETALVRVDGATPLTLARLPQPDDPVTVTDGAQAIEAWQAGDTKLTFTISGDAIYAAGGAPKTCTFAPRSLPAPRVDGVDIYVQGSQAGSTLDVAVGESFAISLSGVPTAGYMWAPEALPPFLEKTGETGGSTSTSQYLPGFVGGNHWEVLVFRANAAGVGELVLVQRRPWEDTGAPDDQRFRLTVRAQ